MVNSASLKDLLIFTRDGEWGKDEPLENSVQMHIIRGTDFSSARYGNLSSVPIRFIPKHIAERKQLEPYDILIETAGGTKDQPTGRTVLLKPHLFNKAKHPITCASFSRFLRVNTELAFPEYIFWFLQYLYETGQMERHQVQHTGVARFQYTNFAETVEIPLPPLDEQKAIAHILGTLDDKIELNQQMNHTLESIARALFKSWFIDFDPVRAKMDGRQPAGMDAETAALFPDEFEDSAIGQIPKGWKVGTIDDATSLIIDHRGKTPTKLGGDWSEDGIPALSAKNIKSGRLIRNDAIRYVDQDLFARWMKNPLVIGDILMTSEAPMGELLYLACNAHYCLSQRLYGIRANPQKCQSAYLFYTLVSDDTQARLAGRATGTTVQGIRQSELRKVEILLPELSIQKKFSSIADPSLIQIHSNEDQNYELVSIRDALLPKLLSGEIRVKDAEKIVEAAA